MMVNLFKVMVEIIIFAVSISTATLLEAASTDVASWDGSNHVTNRCSRSGEGNLRYTWGDAFSDADCLGPDGQEYPTQMISRIVRSYKGTLRKGRSMKDPYDVREKLLDAWRSANENDLDPRLRFQRSMAASASGTGCPNAGGGRLCRTVYNTTAPLYGVSLTSGESVTIIQKFPDLLQQVIFETCVSSKCDVLNGECVQTYTPYLFLVVPLGPVTLTGQDYVMVESGCMCKTEPRAPST